MIREGSDRSGVSLTGFLCGELLMENGVRPKIHVIGTGGTISFMGDSRMDYINYSYSNRHLTIDEMLERVPEVILGSGASHALLGEKGILLGSKRVRCIDVLMFEPRSSLRKNQLVSLRFECFDPWEVIGISLPAGEFGRHKKQLAHDLVPGDLVITELGAFAHMGDQWLEAALRQL